MVGIIQHHPTRPLAPHSTEAALTGLPSKPRHRPVMFKLVCCCSVSSSTYVEQAIPAAWSELSISVCGDHWLNLWAVISGRPPGVQPHPAPESNQSVAGQVRLPRTHSTTAHLGIHAAVLVK